MILLDYYACSTKEISTTFLIFRNIYESSSILLVVGEKRGCGKTAVLANWISEYLEHECFDGPIISHYVGSSCSSSDVSSLMRRVCLEMRDYYPEPGCK